MQTLALGALEDPEAAKEQLDMPGQDGFAVARRLRQLGAPAEVIFLTMHKDEMHFNEALNLGVKGYVIKDSAAADIVHCIKSVMAGQSYISPDLSTFLRKRGRRASALVQQQPGVSELTATERRVLALLAEYKTNRQIAEELFVSVLCFVAGALRFSRTRRAR